MARETERETLGADDDVAEGGPGIGSSTTRATLPESMPDRIGHYHLRRLIASGGMGAVYEAVQDQPRRTVAVKVMRRGMTSRSALRRFEYEAQILARLRHPGIAQIYEAGTHDDGSGGVPYFVMEYIPNARDIIRFSQERHLGSRERLELFLQVCDAVHHGHQKGIIHRDLKPANILVDASTGSASGTASGSRPGIGQAKIIDFGVARATDSDLAVTTLQTDVGQLVGTVQYMSPEQIEADPHDIDIRSDVYALGVLLYELLTEKLPYDVTTVAVYEAARIIREQPPSRLSTINHSLRGDLETITLKALEKSRERRYQSAAELSQDVRHYLNCEPISARPPSLAYQLRSFARRHRTAFATATGIVLALILGIVGTSWGMIQADRQRRLAIDAREQAELEAARATTISKFLKNMLTSVDPAIAQGREVTVRDLLDDLVTKLDGAFPNSPETEAEIRATIGSTYRNLGQYAAAEPQFRRAYELRRETLGEDDPDTLRSMTQIGFILDDEGHRAEAEQQFRAALEKQRRVLGERDPLVLSTTNALAWSVYNQGRPAQAEPLFAETLKLRRVLDGSTAPVTIKTITNLAVTLIDQNKLDDAEPLIDEAVQSSLAVLGERHPDTLYTQSIQAWLFREQHRYDDAVALYQSIVERASIVLGDTHKFTLFWRQAIAWTLYDRGDPAQAEAVTRPVLDARLGVLGPEHPETIDSMYALGLFALAQDHFDDAAREFRRALALCDRALPESDYRHATTRAPLVRALIGLEQYDEAETVAKEYYRLMSRDYGDADAAMQPVYQLLADLYDAWGRADDAATWRSRIAPASP